jgi:hypothetical protein
MHRVKAKVEAEKDKKHAALQGVKRATTDDKSTSRPQQRRHSSQKGPSGASALPPSPSAISPLTINAGSHPVLANQATGSPTNSFTPVGLNGTRSFTPQSQTTSSPAGSELIYPFNSMGPGIYTPFGNSPPLFPVVANPINVQLPPETIDVAREDEGPGQFWQSLFGPPGSSLPPPQYNLGLNQHPFSNSQGANTSSRQTGEFRDPNDVNMDVGESTAGVNLDDIDNGLVDWGDFIAQCSQVWVTE